tara:strand:+ start:79 stop:1062 length:984 start_codon:yes stop_codon:yes gene_type:complete
MSNIAIKGGATGTAVFTLESPATNTNRTLVLPDVTATVITDSAGVLNIGSGQVYKDASGNLGIGTNSPSTYVNSQGTTLAVGTSPNFATIQGRTDGPSGATNGVSYGGSYSTNPINGSRIFIGAAGGAGQQGLITFNTKNLNDDSTQPAERMRIDSAGRIQVNGTTVVDVARISVSFNGADSTGIGIIATSASGGTLMKYQNNAGTQVGAITTNASTTTYGTTSDYRLKEDIAPMTGALAKVALLKPVTYKWKSTGSVDQGFIAHELAEVVPECVVGEKDAVDAEGNPAYQGIDTSFLVATLTAALQEQQAIIEQLQADVATLKGAA